MRISLHDICKHYGPLKANDHIFIDFAPGAIHGILGENGAGKSTLMKILSGYIAMTSGEIRIDNSPVFFKNPGDALQCGIGMLYQDTMDFPQLSVLDNFLIGSFRFFHFSRRAYQRRLEYWRRQLGFHLPFDKPIFQLTVGERQQLELVRLLNLGAEFLILDEPTTGISEQQKSVLFNALAKLTQDGKTILLVSHKMQEVEALCDTVSVLRQGRVVQNAKKPFKKQALLKDMFGEMPEVPGIQSSKPEKPKRAFLTLTDGSAVGGRTGLRHCSVSIQQTEIIGLAGLEGSGQDIFMRVLAGLIPLQTGYLQLNDKQLRKPDYHTLNRHGITFLPAARLEEGLIPGLSILEHSIFSLDTKPLLLPYQSALTASRERIRTYSIKGSPETAVEALSGGNQQRLLLSFLPPDAKLLLLENPTRGLDLSSAHWVWQQLCALRDNGAAIIFSSPDLDEILSYADRIFVFFDGSLITDVSNAAVDISQLTGAIAGETMETPT